MISKFIAYDRAHLLTADRRVQTHWRLKIWSLVFTLVKTYPSEFGARFWEFFAETVFDRSQY